MFLICSNLMKIVIKGCSLFSDVKNNAKIAGSHVQIPQMQETRLKSPIATWIFIRYLLRWYSSENNPRHPSTKNYVIYLCVFCTVALVTSQISQLWIMRYVNVNLEVCGSKLTCYMDELLVYRRFFYLDWAKSRKISFRKSGAPADIWKRQLTDTSLQV
jgi:hypothetical protein